MEFISFLLTAILVLYIIRALVRLLLPMLFQNFMNKAQQQPGHSQNYREGKIKVDHIPETKKGTIPDSEGDFVDYEEIK
ncbi:MAG: DUF4834 domain-containing protein [Mucilaginibacter sp.]